MRDSGWVALGLALALVVFVLVAAAVGSKYREAQRGAASEPPLILVRPLPPGD